MGRGTRLCRTLVFGASVVMLAMSAAGTVTIGKPVPGKDGFLSVSVSTAPTAADRVAFVAWGDSDKGETLAAWGANVKSAVGLLPAGSSSAKLTLPRDVLSAKTCRVFLVQDGCKAAYLQSDGTQYLVTDVYPTGWDTCAYADIALQDTTTVQQRIFGNNGTMNMQAYVNGSKGWSWSYSNGGNWTAATSPQTLVTTDRTQITLDGPNDHYKLVVGGVTKADYTLSSKIANAHGNTSDNPLNILANARNTDKYGNLKLYACTITRPAQGVSRNYVPGVKGGQAGLYETNTQTWLFDQAGGSPLFVGEPQDAAVSDVSEAFETPTAAVLGSGVEAKTIAFVCAPTGAAREIWYAWDASDKGTTFASWANNERVGTLAANGRYAQVAVPPSAIGATAARCFLIAPGGTYDCTYLRAERGQCIDTGIYADSKTVISVDMKLNETGIVQQRAFGTDDSALTVASYINGSGNWAWSHQDAKGDWTGTSVKPTTKRTTLTVDIPNNTYTIAPQGETPTVFTTAKTCTKTATITTTIFAGKKAKAETSGNYIGSTFGNFAIAELYGATVTQDGVKKIDLAPCVTNGVAVMYDSVSKTHFGNAYTNVSGKLTYFVPGGRTDSPAAVATGAIDFSVGARGDDVFADAKAWFKGFATDLTGQGGEVTANSFVNALDGTTQTAIVYGATGRRMVFSNEVVRLPGRGVSRQMQTVYFPQTVTITNATENKGYCEPTTAVFQNMQFGRNWSVMIRCRPDTTAPYVYKFLMSVGHHGGAAIRKGVEFGFRDNDTQKQRLLMFAGGSDMTTSWKMASASNLANNTITNHCVDSWVDIVVVADGQKLSALFVNDALKTDSASGLGVSQFGYQYVQHPIELTPNSTEIRIGAEASRNDKSVYPMGANDNAIKAFRGSIQQVAFWDRSLSKEEMYRAVGYPRTDLWRVGVDNGSASEFSGTMPEGGADVDAERWPLQNGLASGQSVTLKFPLDKDYELATGQLLRWKSLPGSPKAVLAATVNGSSCGTKSVNAGEWAQWFVRKPYLKAGTNTVVITRVDTATGSVVADTVALGGGIQVGKFDGSNSEFSIESAGQRDLYAASGNTRDLRRVILAGYGASSGRTNFQWRVNMPQEMAGQRRWKLTVKVAANYGFSSKYPTLPLCIDLNGQEILREDVKNASLVSTLIDPEDLPAGENVFNFRNDHTETTSGLYISFDAFTLEPLNTDSTMLFLR